MRKTILFICLPLLMSTACNKGNEPESSTRIAKLRTSDSLPDFIATYVNGGKANFYFSGEDENGGSYEIDMVSNLDSVTTTAMLNYSTLESGDMKLEFTVNNVVVNETSFKPNSWPGDCSLLGSRKPKESYDDCFGRNWSNFCCDMSGCAAQTWNPAIVAAAIAISCAFNESKLHSIEYYNVSNQAYEVKYIE